MPQQLLHHFEFRSHTSQQSRIRMAKRVPANAFLDSTFSATGRRYFRRIACPQNGCRPRCRLLAKIQLSGFVQIDCFRHAKSASETNGWTGTGFCDDSILHGPATPYTTDRVTFIVRWGKSMSPHFSPNNSLCRKPVDTARRTNVRSRLARWSTKALISAGIKTTGVLRRFAL